MTNKFLLYKISEMKNLKWVTENPCNLNEFLREKIAGEFSDLKISNGKIRRLIVAGGVKVNGVQCRIASFVLKKGSRVEAFIDEKKFFYEKKPNDLNFSSKDLQVLFEDDFLIVVNKPAFVPTEPTVVSDRNCMQKVVIDYLWEKNPSLKNPPYVGVMHRLDRETSGVLLFTKTRSVNNAVHDMFENHQVEKIYRAVSFSDNADFVKEHFSVENFIGRISAKSARCKIGRLEENLGGKFAKTDFYLAAKKDGLLYFDCKPKTGRTHQIRVHLSGAGFPIVGDELYGGKKGFSQNNNRIMLHAFSLMFEHPVSKEKLKLTAPLPPLFEP